MKLLIVEDEHRIAAFLAKGFTRKGHPVDVVDTGGEALARLAEAGEDYDLVLLDLGLPDVDGTTVLRVLRDRGLRIPVVVLTARNRDEDRERSLALGADAYLVKPIPFGELLERLERELAA